MFNKSLFNKTLFNRLLELFPTKSDILLYGERRGFDELKGLFDIYFNLNGLTNITIDKFGRLLYLVDEEGECTIFYDLDGEQVLELVKGAEAKRIIDLIGKVIKNGKD